MSIYGFIYYHFAHLYQQKMQNAFILQPLNMLLCVELLDI